MITKNIQEINFPNNLGSANRVKFKEVLNPETEYIIGYSADFEYVDGVDYSLVHHKFYHYNELFSPYYSSENIFSHRPSEEEAFNAFLFESLVIPVSEQ